MYGYAVDPPVVERVLREGVGERETNFQDKVGIFFGECRAKVTPSEHTELQLELRRDIDDYDEDTLRGYVIVIAKKRTKVVHKKELARLKAFLQTDAEPQWWKVH